MEMVSEMRDPIELAIFQSSIHSIAEEMGAALRRTSISPNIKERRDYSCALFDGKERVIAMGDHMPVHLGAMPMSVKAVVDNLSMEEGDIAILNDPYAGGTHLPDITLVLPVFLGDESNPRSMRLRALTMRMWAGCTQDRWGRRRRSIRKAFAFLRFGLMRRGEMEHGVLSLLLANVRTPEEREGDLAAQIGACRVGERRIKEVVAKYGLQKVNDLTEELIAYSERLMRAELRKMPAGTFAAEDFWMATV